MHLIKIHDSSNEIISSAILQSISKPSSLLANSGGYVSLGTCLNNTWQTLGYSAAALTWTNA